MKFLQGIESIRNFLTNFELRFLHYNLILSRAKALPQSWWSLGIGRSGFSLGSNFTIDNRFRVEIYIDTGKKEDNDITFGDLLEKRTYVEEKIETELIWEPLPERRACRIYRAIEGNIDDDDEKLRQMIDWAAPVMIRFREVFGPLIKNIQIEE